MRGPYRMEKSLIGIMVPTQRMGYYALLDRDQVVRCVCRADSDLRTRILSHLGDGHEYFTFECTATRKEYRPVIE